MGVMKLSEFRTEIKDTIARDPGDAKLDRWVNDALKELGYSFKFHGLEAVGDIDTVDGTYAYALSALPNFRVVHEDGIWITDPDDNSPCELKPETRRLYMRNQELHTVDNKAVPEFYHLYGGKLYLRPIPDAVYKLEVNYWKLLTKLALPDDVTELPEDFDEAVLLGAIYRGYRAYGEHDRYQNIRNDFLGMVRSRLLDSDIEPFPEGGINVAREAYDV